METSTNADPPVPLARLVQLLHSLTDEDLATVGSAWFVEKDRREDLKFQAKDECPACWGTGEEGNEGDAYTCPRCKGTGKYPSLLNARAMTPAKDQANEK